VARIKQRVGDLLKPGNTGPSPEVRDRLNQILRGWSAYFSYGTRTQAYRAVDHYVLDGVRRFLRRRTRCGREASPASLPKQCLASWEFCNFVKCRWGLVRESAVKPVGKPGARNPHVRFDERGWETGRRLASVLAPILDSTADLFHTVLYAANLTSADLRGADLTATVGLTRQQIESAFRDAAKLPPYRQASYLSDQNDDDGQPAPSPQSLHQLVLFGEAPGVLNNCEQTAGTRRPA
jgi:Group II intron, maturase-specific domain